MPEDARFTLTQEDKEMLENRRALDAQFTSFMQQSLADRTDIRAKVEQLSFDVAENTRTTNEVHTALFAKDDDNDLGITGLVTNMQRVVRHIEVMCNVAKFAKWALVGSAGLAIPLVTLGQMLGWL